MARLINPALARDRATRRRIVAGAAALWLIALAGGVNGETGAPRPADKGQYHLLNPTPRPLMRELSTDRPDTTESPYTVDAGHFQVELSFLEYTRDDGGDDFEEFALLPANIKIGLLNNVDLQLVVTPFVRQEFEDAAGSDDDDASGFGDTQLRLKVNFWGNDGGPTALAFMPFIQFPTGDDEVSANHAEGGLIFPLAVELPAGFGLGLMAEVDFVRDAANDGYDIDFVHTATIGHDLAGPLAGYLEYVGVAPSADDADYIAVLGAGLTYAIGDDVQLDAGVNVGLTDAADDVGVFAGVTFRL